MTDEIEPMDVAAAAKAGFGPQLVSKGEARGLAKESGAEPSVAESVLGRFQAEASGPNGHGHGDGHGEGPTGEDGSGPLSRARALLEKGAIQPGEERARQAQIQMEGEGTVIDRIRVVPDAGRDAYVAVLEQLGAKATITEEKVGRHPRAFRDGFYAEIELAHDSESDGLPFEVTALRPIQESTGELLEELAVGREPFTAGEWAYFLVQSVGLDPFAEGFVAGGREQPGVAPRARAVGLALLRLVPLVEEGYHLVELGPRQTGKSYLYEKFAPRAHLLSGGKASVAKLFIDTRSGDKGLVADQDAIAFDEISSTDFQGDEVVSALQTYMESGQVSRGKTKVKGRASIVMLGNIDGGPGDRPEGSHLFGPFPEPLQDTALMDRVCAYLPGWEVPKIGPGSLAEGVGLTTSFLAECLSRLRRRSLSAQIEKWAPEESPFLRGNLQKRDRDAALQTASGLLKLIYPGLAIAGGDTSIDDVQRPVLRWALWMGLEARLRVRVQQRRALPEEFEEGDFRLQVDLGSGDTREERVFLPEEYDG